MVVHGPPRFSPAQKFYEALGQNTKDFLTHIGVALFANASRPVFPSPRVQSDLRTTSAPPARRCICAHASTVERLPKIRVPDIGNASATSQLDQWVSATRGHSALIGRPIALPGDRCVLPVTDRHRAAYYSHTRRPIQGDP